MTSGCHTPAAFDGPKPITAAAAMICYEAGWFQLDDPLAKVRPPCNPYLPRYVLRCEACGVEC